MPSEIVVSNDGVQPTQPGLDLWVDLTTPASMQSPSIPAFASTAARDSQWPTPYVGALCVTTDTNSLWEYFSTGWYKPFSVLGYAEITASQASISTIVDITSLSISITIPAGRRIKFTAQIPLQSTVDGDYGRIDLTSSDGTVTYQTSQLKCGASGQNVVLTKSQAPPGAGTFTYKLRVSRTSGTGTLTVGASSATIAYLMCEDVGAANA